jgi:hypothetical protein
MFSIPEGEKHLHVSVRKRLTVNEFCHLGYPYENRRFAGTFRRHLQGRQSAEQVTIVQQTVIRSSATSVHIRIRGAITEKMATFITTAVITSDLSRVIIDMVHS